MSEEAGPGILYAIGTGIGMLLSGIVAWYGGRHKQAVQSSEASLEIDANEALRRAFKRLDSEIEELRAQLRAAKAEHEREIIESKQRERRLRMHIHTLVTLMRSNGIDAPEYETGPSSEGP